jgi:ATP-dependent Clp protease ATP-binding subunit ClpA
MFSSELALIIEAAVREAYVMNHAYFSLEHLLYAMLHEGSIEEVVRACGAEPRKIIEEVKDYLGREIETDRRALPLRRCSRNQEERGCEDLVS